MVGGKLVSAATVILLAAAYASGGMVGLRPAGLVHVMDGETEAPHTCPKPVDTADCAQATMLPADFDPTDKVPSDLVAAGRIVASIEHPLRFGLTGLVSDAEAAPVVREIPAPPGGATLVMSGLLMVGAWELLRSVRNSIGRPCGWYQDARAGQGYDALTVDDQPCEPKHIFVLETLSASVDARAIPHNGWSGIPPRVQPRRFIPTVAPRGPPAHGAWARSLLIKLSHITFGAQTFRHFEPLQVVRY